MRNFGFLLATAIGVSGFAGTAIAQDAPEADQVSTSSLLVSAQWDESATKDYYNSTLGFAWERTLGDHAPNAIGTGAVMGRVASATTISIPVTGNDFFIACGSGGTTNFGSREASNPSQAPRLVVNGTHTYFATRDTALAPSSNTPLGVSATLHCSNTVLLAFDGYTPQPGDKAVLQLTATSSTAAQTFTVYRPAPHPGSVYIPSTPMKHTVTSITPGMFKTNAYTAVQNGVVTGQLNSQNQTTAISQLFKLPPASEYYLTVVMKLGDNWPDFGGKLPGLSNTGMGTNTAGTPLKVAGVNCDNAGWGGRTANGCRWSARTGWHRHQGQYVGMNTYYYSVHNGNGWGAAQPMQLPLTDGKWFAYVQRVKINDPGVANGMLSYWVCADAGCLPQFHTDKIEWRDSNVQQSLISEVWANVYCGGTTCGTGLVSPSSASIERLTVTDGLPDMVALQNEVAQLNARS